MQLGRTSIFHRRSIAICLHPEKQDEYADPDVVSRQGFSLLSGPDPALTVFPER
ncbi:Uncharacterised protein [Vibrio cholerae]|nr:Uncharacterised protein [Vibrio cholerae]CSD44786.1 Uncharacterised protein [Vibrio cholerae]CSI29754.1 Uncharacterised protein [Vibrio cholerae]